jgi:hypothetical protein
MSLEFLKARIESVGQILGSDGAQKRISAAAAFAVIGEYKQRIFTEGLATDGTPIGQYSTRPYYQNPNALVGVPTGGIVPQGRTGKTQFKNGKAYKTRYLARGYAELRELTGRQSNTVDLNFSGSLERSIQVVQEDSTAFIRYTNEIETEKMIGNELRFGRTISEPTEDERETGIRAAQLEIESILNEID